MVWRRSFSQLPWENEKSLEMQYFQGFEIVAKFLPGTGGKGNVLLVQGMIEH